MKMVSSGVLRRASRSTYRSHPPTPDAWQRVLSQARTPRGSGAVRPCHGKKARLGALGAGG
jgi:hypothetical protein